ncbi:ATP-grasp domain-containing protein [candidate division KSB1 bacterium]|nr:ATP-grasp domain-containing protein [candidate division KSB1 bacterium]
MIVDFDQLRHHLQHLNRNWLRGWCGQRALDCIGLSRIVPIDFIICCDYGQDISELAKQITVFSIEQSNFVRENWSNNHLEEVFAGELGQRFEKFSRLTRQRYLCYRSIRYLEKLQHQDAAKHQLAAAPLDLKNYFDNKLILYKKLPELKLRVVPGEITRISQVNFNQLSKRYDLPFVIQLPIGSSGNNTFFIYNEEEFRRIVPRLQKTEFKVARYLPSYSLNVNAVLFRGKVHISAPSVQVIGVSQCANRPSIFCGNDFGATARVPIKIIEESYRVTTILSRWLNSEGYRGIFGVDLLVSDDKLYAIEINPRMQNSTDVLTISQIRKNQIPLIGLHLLEFLPENPFTPVAFEPYQLQQGAQIILHNLERKRVRVGGELKPGIYKYMSGDIAFQRKGISLLEDLSPGEFIVNCGVPFKNQIVEKGAPLLKIQTNDLVLQDDLIHLNEWARAITSNIYKRLHLSEPDRNLQQPADRI